MLVDRFGRAHTYLRIAVTDRCNLRCVYCTPATGVARCAPEALLTVAEIVRVARLLVSLGIRKIRLTGGEPTLRPGIDRLVAQLAALPGLETLAMTTNGVLLPGQAAALRASGLMALNVSLDTLREERYARIAGHPGLPRVLAGIQEALAAGFVPLKLNVVVMGGINADELLDFVAFTADQPVNVRFIEYMPFPGNQWQAARFVSYPAMKQAITSRYPLVPLDDAAGVAKRFQVPGFQGTVSFITPLSAAFCAHCDRLRLTADGSLKTCLFHPAEADLRPALRDGTPDAALADQIRRAVGRKLPGHRPVADLVAGGDRSMLQIGG